MNEESSTKKRRVVGGFFRSIVLIAITAIITYYVTVNVTIEKYLSKANSAYMTTKMSLVKSKLEETYIYDLNEDEMIEGAIKGYVSGLGDKYTQYLTKDELTSLMESTTGSYVGIGVYMANSTELNGVVIVGIIEGSTAERAGLQVGDVISKVNDVDYIGKKSEDVATAIKGEEGTEVKVTIIRNSEEIDYNLMRASVKIKTVTSEIIDDNIAYIKISSFDNGTANEFRDHYNKLKEQNPKGLVIDLRNNGGGLVTESLSLADTMVEKGSTLLITRDKDGKEQIDKAKENPIVDIPVVILVNNNTASASEILAGSLRDNRNYKIIGTNSYGKGVIQSVFSFKDGTGVKVTTNEYFSPNHNVINGVGIKPDIEVELNDEWNGISSVPYENDLQLQRAIEELK
ncbi:MAG: S41 family peptidase [Clostridia bacterium]|nr:S41 family peptidase [Clostridia bacterium]